MYSGVIKKIVKTEIDDSYKRQNYLQHKNSIKINNNYVLLGNTGSFLIIKGVSKPVDSAGKSALFKLREFPGKLGSSLLRSSSNNSVKSIKLVAGVTSLPDTDGSAKTSNCLISDSSDYTKSQNVFMIMN